MSDCVFFLPNRENVEARVYLSCSLDCAGGRLPGGLARKMGKVSTLCGPEISFESPQITPPLALTTDALANSAIRQPRTVLGSELLGSVHDALLCGYALTCVKQMKMINQVKSVP